VPKEQVPALESGLMSQHQLSEYLGSHQRLSPRYQLNLQPGERTLYQVLQVDPQAEPEVIDAAFKRLAIKYHPDRQDTGSTEAMRALLEAKEVLSDPAKRAEYDNRIGVVRWVEALRPEDV
jgi:DnaJ-domain-containing protein 1